MSRLSDGNIHLQRQLFPALEEEIGTLSQRERNFVRVLELANTPAFTATMGRCGTERRPSSREALAKSYVAKAVWNLPSTAALVDMVSSSPHLRRLCGWDRVADIPHESVFSRTFAEFSERALPQQIHEGLVKAVHGDTLCGHVSRDSTAIDGREKPAPKKEAKPRKRQKRGRLERGRCAKRRSFAAPKSNRDGRHVRVRGPKKVACHLMFGVLASPPPSSSTCFNRQATRLCQQKRALSPG
ncbi:MAG: transposase [Kiritimatiellales bacterium]|nr:transposase [Kiritimatiellales bacterium]